MKKTENLKSMAGGRALLDPVALSFMLPLMLVSSLLTVNHSGNFESFMGWLVANLIAFAACAMVVIFLIRMPFKNRAIKPIPLFLVFSVGAVLGLIKGTVTALVAYRLGFFVQFDQLFVSRILQTTIVGLISIPALAVIGDFRFRYQEERDRLVLHKVQKALEQTAEQQIKFDSDEKAILLNFVKQAKSMIQENASFEAAILIRNIIENNLRPLSHRLWNVESSKLTNFNFRALMRLGLSEYPFLLKPMIFVYAPISFLFLLPMYGPLKAVSSTALAVLAIVIIFGSANLIRPKNSQVPVLALGLIIAFTTALVMISPALVFEQDSTTWDAGIWLSTFILLFEIAFVSSLIAAIISNHNMNRSELNELLGGDASRTSLEDRELANFLHGNVQNRLLAIALSIESNQIKESDVIAELDRVEKLLIDEFVNHNTQTPTHLPAAIENLRNRWLGFVSIDVTLIGLSDYSEVRSGILVQVLNEAITNSVRHGLAKNIKIQISQTALRWEVVVVDDGIGVRQGNRGLGSEYFDSVANLGWSLAPHDSGGSVLKLALTPDTVPNSLQQL